MGQPEMMRHKGNVSGRPENISLHHRPTVARIFGLLGPISLPVAGLPLGVVLGILGLGLRRPSVMPRMSRAIAMSSVVAAGACLVSAHINGVPASAIPAQLLAVGILLFAYRATIDGLDSAAILVGWLALSSTLYTIAFGSSNTRGSFEALWKFGIAYTATIFILYLAARLLPTIFSIIVLFALGAMGTFLNFRSFGLVCAVAGAMCIAKAGRRGNTFRTIVLASMAVLAISYLLPLAIDSGAFGTTTQYKSLSQADNGPAILGGRTDPPLSIAAIQARPLLGWGNAQSIDGSTVNHAVAIAQSLGMNNVQTYTQLWIRSDGFVSLHSMLFVPWVEGGPVAAFPMLLMIGLFVWAAIVARGRWGVLVTLVSLQSIWDVLFSPWTGARVVAVAAAAVLAGFAVLGRATSRSAATMNLAGRRI
jgi:hypothetical protein